MSKIRSDETIEGPCVVCAKHVNTGVILNGTVGWIADQINEAGLEPHAEAVATVKEWLGVEYDHAELTGQPMRVHVLLCEKCGTEAGWPTARFAENVDIPLLDQSAQPAVVTLVTPDMSPLIHRAKELWDGAGPLYPAVAQACEDVNLSEEIVKALEFEGRQYAYDLLQEGKVEMEGPTGPTPIPDPNDLDSNESVFIVLGACVVVDDDLADPEGGEAID